MIITIRAPWKQLIKCKRYIHFFKIPELNQPEYYSKPLDENALALVNKYCNDIHYSSYIDLNKKHLSQKQRVRLVQSIKQKAIEEKLNLADKTTSVIVDKLKKIDAEKNDCNEQTLTNPSKEIVNEEKEEEKEVDSEKRKELAKSKLKIITEMGLRRSALEHEFKELPDNWMQDYETYDESDISYDTQYGTPGI